MIRTDVKLGLCPADECEALAAAVMAEFGKHIRFAPARDRDGIQVVFFLEVTKQIQALRGEAFVQGWVKGRESGRADERRQRESRAESAREFSTVVQLAGSGHSGALAG